jgi:hypothetical protein
LISIGDARGDGRHQPALNNHALNNNADRLSLCRY